MLASSSRAANNPSSESARWRCLKPGLIRGRNRRVFGRFPSFYSRALRIRCGKIRVGGSSLISGVRVDQITSNNLMPAPGRWLRGIVFSQKSVVRTTCKFVVLAVLISVAESAFAKRLGVARGNSRPSGASQPPILDRYLEPMPHCKFDDDFRAWFRELILCRRDVRKFLPTPLPHGLLVELIDLACFAPSVGFERAMALRSGEREQYARFDPSGIREGQHRSSARVLGRTATSSS